MEEEQRLIDANKLLGIIQSEEGIPHARKLFALYIQEAPTIDPIKHGHWKWVQDADIRYRDWYPHCSECGTVPYRKNNRELPHYCPECGAKMDKEEAK